MAHFSARNGSQLFKQMEKLEETHGISFKGYDFVKETRGWCISHDGIYSDTSASFDRVVDHFEGVAENLLDARRIRLESEKAA